MRHLIILNGIWPWPGQNSAWAINRSMGAYQIRHWLKKFGFSVQVIDFCQILTVREIKTLLEQFIGDETFAVGFSTTYWPKIGSAPSNMTETISWLRSNYSQIKLVGGGMGKKTFDSLFDVVFVGQSEDAFVSWCQQQIGKSNKSLFNKKFNITELDHKFQLEDCILPFEVLPIELGRGCIFKCKFCAHPNLGKPKFTYQRHFDLIIDEMKYNHQQFGVTRYNFMDDTVNEDIEKVENLSRLPDSLGFEIMWNGYLRADLIWSRKGTDAMLKRSGMKTCYFGIETFNPAAGKAIDKGWGAKHGKEYLPHLYENVWQKDINIRINFIVGLPGESLESSEETFNWCMHQDFGMSQFTALDIYEANAGEITSEFSRNYKEHGYVLTNPGWKNEFMTSQQAADAALRFNKELGMVNKVSSWPLFSVISLGTDYEIARQMKVEELYNFPFAVVQKFKQQYISKLKQLKE